MQSCNSIQKYAQDVNDILQSMLNTLTFKTECYHCICTYYIFSNSSSVEEAAFIKLLRKLVLTGTSALSASICVTKSAGICGPFLLKFTYSVQGTPGILWKQRSFLVLSLNCLDEIGASDRGSRTVAAMRCNKR